jgi:ribose transport system ATP-binding protein
MVVQGAPGGDGEEPEAALELAGVSKRFGAVQALDDVGFKVRRGEVHGLVGHNGSGKSTLVKIMDGVYTADSGEVVAFGKRLGSAGMSRGRGVGFVHQDLAVVDGLQVRDNFGATLSFGSGAFGPIRTRREDARFTGLAKQFGLTIDPAEDVANLSPGERANVALMRVLRELEVSDTADQSRQLLVLDEATAYMSRAEAAEVFAVARAVATRGGSALLVTHRLRDVLEVCDRVTVLRGGKHVGTVACAGLTEEALLSMMLGRRAGALYPDRVARTRGDRVVFAEGLGGDQITDFSFDLHAGEIVGITGLVGSGHDELPYLLVGASTATSGTVRIAGAERMRVTPKRALNQGIVLVPGNRQRDAAWRDGTVTENVTMPYLARYMHGGRLRHRDELRDARAAMDGFDVVPRDPHLPFSAFSGGNQQKILIARALQGRPRLLILHEPTQGIDVGAKKDILTEIQEIAGSGCAVLIVTSEYEDLEHMCDKVLVVNEGRLSADLTGRDVTEERILLECHAA